MSKFKLSPHDEAFLDAMAMLMAPWGWVRPVGRIYAYLLLREEPATLDEIAADLGMSKSNASVAARMLEQFGNARRHSVPGSRRITYSAPDVVSGPFASKTELLDRIVRLLAANHAIGRTDEVNARLATMGRFYEDMREAVQGVIDRYAGTGSDEETATKADSFGSSFATRAR
jgi:hypothetical protein